MGEAPAACGTVRAPPTAEDGGTPPPEASDNASAIPGQARPGEPNALKAGWP